MKTIASAITVHNFNEGETNPDDWSIHINPVEAWYVRDTRSDETPAISHPEGVNLSFHDGPMNVSITLTAEAIDKIVSELYSGRNRHAFK